MTFCLTPPGSEATPPARPRAVARLVNIWTGEPTGVCVVQHDPALRRCEPIAVYLYDDGTGSSPD